MDTLVGGCCCCNAAIILPPKIGFRGDIMLCCLDVSSPAADTAAVHHR
jgi:hypothetical protein